MKTQEKLQSATIQATETTTSHEAIARYQRAVNYLSAAQIYLQSNPLLREPLQAEHI